MAQTQTPAYYGAKGSSIPCVWVDGTDYVGNVKLIGTIPMIWEAIDPYIDVGQLSPDGIWNVPKDTSTFAIGDPVYWDENGSPVGGTALSGAATSTASGNNLMGLCVPETTGSTSGAATGAQFVRTLLTAAKRTTTIAGSVTADDITGSDSSLGIAGLAAAQGGAIAIAGGTSSTGGNAGGAVSLVGGTPGATGVGGAASVAGGVGGATSGAGGAVAIAGGAGTAGNANGGAVTIQGGEPHGSGQQGTVTIQGARMAAGTTASAITGATTLTLADAGGVFEIDQDAAFDIALPDPTTGPGCRYTFVISDAGANNVTISTTGASTFIGTIVNDVTSVIPATGSTLTFATGTAAVGDTIEAVSVSTTLYLIRAVTSAAGGITVA